MPKKAEFETMGHPYLGPFKNPQDYHVACPYFTHKGEGVIHCESKAIYASPDGINKIMNDLCISPTKWKNCRVAKELNKTYGLEE